jgi:hypothetical protein
MPGPPAKRVEERRRRNKPERPIDRVAIGGDIDDLFGDGEPDAQVETRSKLEDESVPVFVPKPAADDDWHPIAQDIYDSLGKSGQKMFFEPSDWAVARLLCESISRDLKPQKVNVAGPGEPPEFEEVQTPMKGANLAAYLKGFAALGMTEADRRRMSMEFSRPAAGDQPLPDGVTDINAAREGMFG